MTPGATLIYECPSCQGLFARDTIASGNTFGAKMRSDGRLKAPMLPTTPPLIACPHCETTLCFFDLTPIDKYEYGGLDRLLSSFNDSDEESRKKWEQNDQNYKKYRNTRKYETASGAACLSYLTDVSLSPEQEKFLRYYTMQAVNDARLSEGRVHLTSSEISNLNCLLQLLSKDQEEELFLRAEIFRELSRFDEAKACLDRDFDNRAMAEQIFSKAEQHDFMTFTFVDTEDEYDLEYAWDARRYHPEEIQVPIEDLNPPLFKINNRDWHVKVLGMLSHNWALIEQQSDRKVTVYFFHDQVGQERAGVIDSLDFSEYVDAIIALQRNGFESLKNYPGPWVGLEPKGYFFDARMFSDKPYSGSYKFWTD